MAKCKALTGLTVKGLRTYSLTEPVVWFIMLHVKHQANLLVLKFLSADNSGIATSLAMTFSENSSQDKTALNTCHSFHTRLKNFFCLSSFVIHVWPYLCNISVALNGLLCHPVSRIYTLTQWYNSVTKYGSTT